MTLQALFESYKIARCLEQTTAVNYQSAVNVFDRWAASKGLKLVVDQIDIDVLNRFLTDYGRDVARYTVNSKRRILIALLNYFLEPRREVVTSKFVKRQRVSETRRTTWQPYEIDRLVHFAGYLPGVLSIGTARAQYFQSLILLAWETGARRGDLVRITIEDIASRKPFLFIQSKTKTGVVYELSDSTIDRVLAMPHARESRVALPAWTGDQWQLEAITKTSREIMLAAGLASHDGCLKKLRRSAVTRADEIKPGTGYRFAGHRNQEITDKHYLDPTRATRGTTHRHYIDGRHDPGDQADYLPEL